MANTGTALISCALSLRFQALHQIALALTRIEPDEHGAFPRERIHRAIEGIETTPGHARSEMPVWGFALAPLDRDADPAFEVRSRIATLVDYLETLQAPPD